MNFSHPIFEWEPGFPSTTDKLTLRRRTPCSAHDVKSPWLFTIFKSSSISLNIFFSDAGIFIFLFTENAKPLATPIVGYGSCPIITILVVS